MTEDRQHILVCERVDDFEPRVLSRMERCGDCDARVWVADSSPKDVTGFVCKRCFMASPPPPDTEISPPTAEQLADIKGGR